MKKTNKEFLKEILKARKDASKVLKPQILYDKEYDILWIRWFPNLKTNFSVETNEDMVFDIGGNHGVEEVVGIEIMDFKERFLK